MKTRVLPMVLLPISAMAASTSIMAEEKNWTVTSELGIILTQGNTETTTVKGAITAKHDMESWNNEYKFDALYKEDEVENNGAEEQQRTAERYFASAQGNYKLGQEFSHFFLYGSYTSDYFGAFREESVFSLGYGKRFLNTETMTLDAEIGPGYKYFKYSEESTEVDEDNNNAPLAGETDSNGIIRARGAFNWQISENAQFKQSLAFEVGEDNTQTKSETALLTKINGSLQMKVGFNITNNSDAPDGTESTDTETVLTLVYNF